MLQCATVLYSDSAGAKSAELNKAQFLSPKYLPAVESISLFICADPESIPTDFAGFVHLRDLDLTFVAV
jgi:hypothetical protein